MDMNLSHQDAGLSRVSDSGTALLLPASLKRDQIPCRDRGRRLVICGEFATVLLQQAGTVGDAWSQSLC